MKKTKKAPFMTKIENNAYFGMRNPNFIVDFPENAIFRKIDLIVTLWCSTAFIFEILHQTERLLNIWPTRMLAKRRMSNCFFLIFINVY